MRDYGKIFTSFWTSQTTRALSEDGRTLALYLLSSPHSNIIGVFRVPDGYVAEDLQWSSERVSKAFDNLSQNGWATRNKETGWVVICHYLKWNPVENPNQVKSALKQLDATPNSVSEKSLIARTIMSSCERFPKKLIHEIANRLKTLSETHAETLPKGFPNHQQQQDQDQQQDQEEGGEASRRGGRIATGGSLPLDLKSEAPVEKVDGHRIPADASPRLLAIIDAMKRTEFLVPGKGNQTIWQNTRRPAELAEKLDASCPSVDVAALIVRLAGWSVANPSRAKRDLGKFLWNAATHEQDKPKTGGVSPEAYRHGTDLAAKVRGTRRGADR
jgi:hypothetical protein